jgi:hypothetical protein
MDHGYHFHAIEMQAAQIEVVDAGHPALRDGQGRYRAKRLLHFAAAQDQ